jgi:hypothetical protein
MQNDDGGARWIVDSGRLPYLASYLRWIILILAILFIALGIFREEVALVFRKATKICFECIGIG